MANMSWLPFMLMAGGSSIAPLLMMFMMSGGFDFVGDLFGLGGDDDTEDTASDVGYDATNVPTVYDAALNAGATSDELLAHDYNVHNLELQRAEAEARAAQAAADAAANALALEEQRAAAESDYGNRIASKLTGFFEDSMDELFNDPGMFVLKRSALAPVLSIFS